MTRWRIAALGTVVVAGVLVSTCGGGSSPASNTPVPTTPAAPLPTPAPTPTPIEFCKLGYGPGSGTGCQAQGPAFLEDVDQAINQAVAQYPQYFDTGSNSGNGQYRILSEGGYYVAVIRNLQAKGLCAGFDGEELQVKSSNDFNDQYDIATANGFIRRGSSSYRTTCAPASFPKPPRPYPDNNGCSLPPSIEVACGRYQPTYLGDVDSAIEELSKKQPAVLDVGDRKGGPDWYKVLNIDGYVQGVATILKSRGFCARWDGEELVVKKENAFSDHYDILTSENYTRRGAGSYRSSCYPAAF